MNNYSKQVMGAVYEVLFDFAISLALAVAFYFILLIGGASQPLGAAIGLSAWVFCIFSFVHCMMTDGAAIMIVTLLLGSIGIVVGLLYLIFNSLLRFLV
jgi:uncharacterized membrane protein YjjB (DUF3815 family)